VSSRVQSVLHRAERALALGTSRVRLRSVSALGARPRASGAPFVDNHGRIEIGDDFFLSSHPVVSHMVCERGARITIGDGVSIGSGAAIACQLAIRIDDGVRIGRNVMILDTDFHELHDMNEPGEPLPVVIERGARLDDGVVVLKGARVGAGARIGPNSVVSGTVEPGVFASGVPARPARKSQGVAEGDLADRVRAIVAETFDTARPVELGDGPREIPRWDSLGTLRLLLAIEDEIGVRLPDGGLYGAKTVSDVVTIAEAALVRTST
jgi:acetyltransferase-like isoleucine patch superfamily enzyme/acyl carrier protein